MMVDGAEEGQLKGPIDVLAPYNSHLTRHPAISQAALGLVNARRAVSSASASPRISCSDSLRLATPRHSG
jgi:hypothetical protein